MHSANEAELKVRRKLGIPDSARRVLLIQESSHWDTNWLKTSTEYFKDNIEPIFEAILEELLHDPRRVFAIESVYFLKRYWETHPRHRDALKQLLDCRRLRLIGASLTTPDTLLPHPESVLRDYLLGQQWLRAIGCDVYPKVAYFPDNFGHSPGLPSLMRAVGVEAVGVTRIDGMHFVGSDWRLPGAFPLKGSTAHQLQKEHRTLDFVWRDAAGAEVMCHWNAFTYFQADMLGHLGIIRWSGKLFGVPLRGKGHVGRQLDGFARKLEALSQTPYLFCPIGCDFNPPIRRLGELIATYNDERSARTGTHVVLAGLDDYFELLEFHRQKLPVLEVDPNPAWMGFYASRPELKTRHARAARQLLVAEAHEARTGVSNASLPAAWELIALSNHHDFITGTSPDRVVAEEQVPWLARAEALLHVARALPESTPIPRVRRVGHTVEVQTPHYRLTLSEDFGGCVTSLVDAKGRSVLRGLGFDLAVYRDSGGLWRLGHEYAGGTFRLLHRASERPADVAIVAERDCLKLVVRCWLDGALFIRTLTCRNDVASLELGVEGLPPARTTVTCLFEMAEELDSLRMDVAGGLVRRPLHKLYAPTFWPALSTVEAGRTLLCLDAPTGITASASGNLEWMVARHATKERAFGLLPVLAHPVSGSVTQTQTHAATLFIERTAMKPHAWVSVSDDRLRVVAVKRAENGRGTIVRFHWDSVERGEVSVGFQGAGILEAHRCDARERDLGPLWVDQGLVRFQPQDRIISLRISAEPTLGPQAVAPEVLLGPAPDIIPRLGVVESLALASKP